MFVPVGDALINTVAFGSGPRTVLAHGGWTGSWELWAEPFELLQPRWRCVSYDHRGCGETRVDPARITLGALVDDLFAVMDARGVDRCVLAGESRGAQVVLLAAARHPERFEGLALVAPAVSADPAPADFVAALRADYAGAVRGFVDACLPEAGSEHLRRWGRDILGRAEPEAAVALLECAFEPPDYARLTMPVVVIHGTLDAIASIEAAERLADDLPDATFHALDGVGHVPTMSVPGRVATIISDRFDAGPDSATTPSTGATPA